MATVACGVCIPSWLAPYALGDLTGVTSLGPLLDGIAFVVAAVAGQLHVACWRYVDGRPEWRYVWTRIIAALLVIVTLITTWVVAPVHTVAQPNMRALAGESWAVLINSSLMMMTTLTCFHLIAVGALRAARSGHDIARAVTLYVLGVACFLANSVSVLFVIANALRVFKHASQVAALENLATVIFPYSSALFAVSILALPVVSWISQFLRVRAVGQRIQPLWEHLISFAPSVIVDHRRDMPWQPLHRKSLHVTRMVTEICDAMHLVNVDIDRTLAEALLAPRQDGVPAVMRLPQASSRQETIKQIVTLAGDFEKASESGRKLDRV